MYPIDVFQTFRFQIYMQVWNDETIEQKSSLFNGQPGSQKKLKYRI